MNKQEKKIIEQERFFSGLNLSTWEKDILLEFNESTPIDELLELVQKGYYDHFLTALAAGITQYKHKNIKVDKKRGKK